MVKLWRCEICGDAYIGEIPRHCPFCGAHQAFIQEAGAVVTFEVPLRKDRANAEPFRSR